MIIATAAACLALPLYHEARGEPVMGRYAVALVTMNRAKQDHETVCREVFRSKQFSWTTGVRKVPGGWYIPAHLSPKEEDAWRDAKIIARTTLQGRMPDFTKGATHYHATYVRPYWASAFTEVRTIGLHRFYAQPS
jgi:N-acetylmuramoyl-L-alanine amidase